MDEWCCELCGVHAEIGGLGIIPHDPESESAGSLAFLGQRQEGFGAPIAAPS
jgi:hypothetical protein